MKIKEWEDFTSLSITIRVIPRCKALSDEPYAALSINFYSTNNCNWTNDIIFVLTSKPFLALKL